MCFNLLSCNMIKYLPGLLLLAVFGCKEAPKSNASSAVNEKIALMKTDQAFSDMSMAKGMKAAFIEYIDSNGVLLRSGHLPIIGASAIDFLIQQNDTSYNMSWQPQNAFVSQSADMGYTYGIYAVRPTMMDTILYGTYVSIWRKQADGKWKFVLDSGNEGIDSSYLEY